MKSVKYKSEFLNQEIELDYVVNNKYKINDAFYFLDGQNAFSDDKATYGRSLRALKHLDKMKKGYIAIAIHSPKTDQERLNMYSPFVINNGYIENFKNNPKICLQFVSEIEHIILPYIEHKYKISNHHLIASSLAASLAIYINSVSKQFKSMCILSNSNFIFDEAMYKHLEAHPLNHSFIYLGVGKHETSDNIYESKLYINAFNKYKNYLDKINAKYLARISLTGKHNEASWEKHFSVYIKKIASS